MSKWPPSQGVRPISLSKSYWIIRGGEKSNREIEDGTVNPRDKYFYKIT